MFPSLTQLSRSNKNCEENNLVNFIPKPSHILPCNKKINNIRHNGSAYGNFSDSVHTHFFACSLILNNKYSSTAQDMHTTWLQPETGMSISSSSSFSLYLPFFKLSMVYCSLNVPLRGGRGTARPPPGGWFFSAGPAGTGRSARLRCHKGGSAFRRGRPKPSPYRPWLLPGC